MLLRALAQNLRSKWKLFAEAWESVQVELHGSYSSARVLELADFACTSNWFRDVAVLIGIPLPCVVVTVLIDTVPLAKPSDSIEANTMSFVRVYYSFVIFSLVATHQVRTIMPPQPFSGIRGLLNSLVVSAITVAVLYGLTRAIGFPLPFSIMTVSPAWVVLVAIFVLAEWANQIRSSRKTQRAVIDLIKLWICDALMVFIYPAFFYIFTTLSMVGQRIFALLLPVIKLLMRNLFARVTVHLSDATPEFVVFHAEVFNSLFMSYCMQTSPSIWTTLQITIADALLTIISLGDIENARRGLRNLERRIDKKNGWGSFHSSVQTEKYLRHTTLDRASKLLQLDENNESVRVSSVADLLRIASYREVVPRKESGRTLAILKKAAVISNKVGPTKGTVHTTDENHDLSRNGSSQASITLRYTCKVRRLLYMAEFLILLNYVEVFIPMVFSINTLATYYLPNREYYPVFKGMDQNRLVQTLQNVMFYCFLQVVSLALLITTLKRMLGFSPTRQLVFVLEKQFHRVHSSVVFWVFYNIQASIQHSGVTTIEAYSQFSGLDMLAPRFARYSAPNMPSSSLPNISTMIQTFMAMKEQAENHSTSAPLFALIAVARVIYQRHQEHLEQQRQDQHRHRYLLTDSDTDEDSNDEEDKERIPRRKIPSPIKEWTVVAEDNTKTLTLVYYPEEETREEVPEENMESLQEKTLVLVIPGNPGNPYFNVPLMQEIVKKHGRSHEVRCLAHAGHVIPWKTHNRDFTLQEQMDHKTFYIKQRLRDDPTLRLVVIGHSIGSHIALHVAKQFPGQIAKLVLMQPVIMHVALSRKGKQFITILNNYEFVVMFMGMIDYLVPVSLRRWLVRRSVGSQTEKTVRMASLSLVNSCVIHNVLGMKWRKSSSRTKVW